MTRAEFENNLNRLVTNIGIGFSNEDKIFIEKAYRMALNKFFVRTSCGQCYKDALIEIYTEYRKNKTLNMENSKFRLRNGALLQSNILPEVVSFKNLTDELAVKFLYHHPELKEYFAEIPDNLNSLLSKYKKSLESDKKVSEEEEDVESVAAKNEKSLEAVKKANEEVKEEAKEGDKKPKTDNIY